MPALIALSLFPPTTCLGSGDAKFQFDGAHPRAVELELLAHLSVSNVVPRLTERLLGQLTLDAQLGERVPRVPILTLTLH